MGFFTFRLGRSAAVGAVAIGAAVAMSTLGIVRAERARPDMTFNCSSGTACVEGDSTGKNTYGAYGISGSADGVHGTTSSTAGHAGVSGVANGATGSGEGVYGRSANGYGVYGTSALSGSAGAGVYGRGTSLSCCLGYGVQGSASGPLAIGVFGEGNFVGVDSYSNAKYGVALRATSVVSPSQIFEGLGSGSSSCVIDNVANLTCTGTIKGGALSARRRTRTGQHVLTYASESASETVEDVGTARMSGGVANVLIDPAFASVMDGKWYYVFLTPLGDTRGLFVSLKTPSGFQVRETEHGRSSLEFDYRIVAHPLDAGSDRLPPAPAMRQTRVIRPPSDPGAGSSR